MLEHINQATIHSNYFPPTVSEGWADELTPLSCRFSLIEEIRSSNKTRCFIAQDKQEAEASSVRLQLLSRDKTEKESDLLTFLLEAQAAAQLSHRHIVASTKPEQIGKLHFYVSDHRPQAVPLRSIINRQGWFDVETAIAIASQIAEALHYAHQAGIWHLKLNPDSVWIDNDHQVRLADFGMFASPLREWALERRSQDCPLPYRTPEQLDAGRSDERSDLYMLGILLYEMLTDGVPFEALTENQLRQKIALQKAPAVHLIRPDIPEALGAMVAKLISENPAARFQNAAAVHSAFVDALSYGFSITPAPEETAPEAPVEKIEEAHLDAQDEPAIETARVEETEPLIEPALAEEKQSNIEDQPETDESELEPLLAPDTQAGGLSLPQPFEQPIERNRQSALAQTTNSTPLPLEERRASTGSLTIEKNPRWKFLPFTLLVIGFVLLAAVSVFTFKGGFKKSPAPQSSASPNELPAASPATEKNPLPEAGEKTEDVSDATSTGSSSLLPSDAATPSRKSAPEFSDARNSRSLSASSSKPDVSRLRQQLRRINEARARNSRLTNRQSYATSRPRRVTGAKRTHKWRVW
jgi:serine/threonine protein kinase